MPPIPSGPLALLPARGGFSNIVWSTSIDHAAQLEALSPTQFAAAVNAALRSPSSTTDGGALTGALQGAWQFDLDWRVWRKHLR